MKNATQGLPDYSVFQVPWQHPSAPVRWTLRLLALLALGIACLLSWVALTGDGVPGCGDSGAWSCDEVIQSRWSKWFGLPVSLPAVSLYGMMLAALGFVGPSKPENVRRSAAVLVMALSITAFGAALWFVGLQIFVIKQFCYWCLGVHACGLSVAAVALIGRLVPLSMLLAPGTLGTASLVTLLAGQFMVVQQSQHKEERIVNTHSAAPLVIGKEAVGSELPPADNIVTVPRQHVGEAPRPDVSSRMISLMDGKVSIDVYQQPLLGSPEAKHVLVKLYDYTCHHCRKMHQQLQAVRDSYPGQVAVLMAPVPMDKNCNELVHGTPPRHRNACFLARLALAVWRADPEAFAQYDAWLFEPPAGRTPNQALEQAISLVGQDALVKHLHSPALEKQLQQGIQLYKLCKAGKIPKLLFPKSLLSGPVLSKEELFKVFQRQFDLAPVE